MLVNRSVITETPIKSRFTQALANFSNRKLVDINSIRENCSGLSELTRELLIRAEQTAIKNLENKKIVKVHLLDGTEEGTFGYRVMDSKDTRKLMHGETVIEITGKDYFITKTGSFGRGDDFLPHSDLDFIVFPTNEESIPYASALQLEITEVLKKEVSELDLPIKVDETLNTLDNFQINLSDIPERLFVLEKPEYMPEFNMTVTRDCFIHSAFRDLEFVSGNSEGFKTLQKIIDPTLYPYSNGSVNNEVGIGLLKALVEEVKSARDIDTSNISKLDVKRNGLRLIQFYNWILRSRFGIKENSVFKSLNTIQSTGVLALNDSHALPTYYSNLLQVRNAIGIARKENPTGIGNCRTTSVENLIERTLEPLVCEQLGMKPNELSILLREQLIHVGTTIEASLNHLGLLI